MNYQLKIREEITGIEILPLDTPQTAQVIILDKKMEVSFQTISANRLLLTIDGSIVSVFLINSPEGKHIFINGQSFLVSEIDSRAESSSRRKKLEDALGEVTPPMPSVVVRILVNEGDWVSRGQGLIVVSAMKMETTLKAPIDGRILKINTALQSKVMPGDKLVEIEAGTKNK